MKSQMCKTLVMLQVAASKSSSSRADLLSLSQSCKIVDQHSGIFTNADDVNGQIFCWIHLNALLYWNQMLGCITSARCLLYSPASDVSVKMRVFSYQAWNVGWRNHQICFRTAVTHFFLQNGRLYGKKQQVNNAVSWTESSVVTFEQMSSLEFGMSWELLEHFCMKTASLSTHYFWFSHTLNHRCSCLWYSHL